MCQINMYVGKLMTSGICCYISIVYFCKTILSLCCKNIAYVVLLIVWISLYLSRMERIAPALALKSVRENERN